MDLGVLWEAQKHLSRAGPRASCFTDQTVHNIAVDAGGSVQTAGGGPFPSRRA